MAEVTILGHREQCLTSEIPMGEAAGRVLRDGHAHKGYPPGALGKDSCGLGSGMSHCACTKSPDSSSDARPTEPGSLGLWRRLPHDACRKETICVLQIHLHGSGQKRGQRGEVTRPRSELAPDLDLRFGILRPVLIS